jgi:MFS family permease
MTAFSGSFEELVFWRFLAGFAAVMWQQARLAMIADTGGIRQRGRLIIWMGSFSRFGNLFAPVIGGFVGEIDIRAPFLVHGILLLLVLVPVTRLAKETRPVVAKGEDDRGEWSYVWTEVRRPQVLYFLAAQFMANLTRGNTAGILNLYVAYAYGVGPATLGLMGTANSLITLPIGFATGWIMDRFGRKMTLVPGFSGVFVTAIFIGMMAAVDAPFYLFLVAYFLLHASQAVTSGNMQVLGSDLAPERARGRFFAVWRMFGEGGSAISPIIFAWIAVAASYAAAFTFVGISALTVALIIGLRIKETVGKLKEEEAAAAATPAPQPATRV